MALSGVPFLAIAVLCDALARRATTSHVTALMAISAALSAGLGAWCVALATILTWKPRWLRRVNRRLRRAQQRRRGFDPVRHPIPYAWNTLRQCSASAWVLRALAVGVPMGLALGPPLAARVLLHAGLALGQPGLAAAASGALIRHIHIASSFTGGLVFAFASGVWALINLALADLLADRTTRRCSGFRKAPRAQVR
ncbi:MAG: hypothetical protein D6692_08620 [Planctomycetota bacterium]|nr:MAG: hypothetical protein D6692_08620 [Planctomycetota bacterium]